MSERIGYWARRAGRRRFLGMVGLGATAAAIAAACGSDKKEETRATSAAGAGGSPAAGQAATQAATAAGKAVRGGTLTGLIERDVSNFDPIRLNDTYSGVVVTLTTDTLFEVDKDENIVGRLVEKVENPQPNVYVFNLRKGVKFQDGTDLNAEAVKFNLERHLKDEKSVQRQNVRDIELIETPDPTTVKITLKAPFAPFTNKLTGGAGIILSPAVVQKQGEALARDLTGAGSGPFKFVEWKRDTQVTLERNDAFWRKDADGAALPYLDKIVIKPFPDENVRLTNLRTGDADVLIGNPPFKDIEDLKKSNDLAVREITGSVWYFFAFNTQKEPFTNPAARRALSYVIDREQIKKTVFFNTGKVLDTPVPDTIPWAQPADHPYAKRDIAKAKQELAAAGKAGGAKFTVQAYNSSPEWQQSAELIKDQAREIGLDMDIQLLEAPTVVDNGLKGNFQTVIIRWTGSGPDPDDSLYNIFYTKSGFNLPQYSNPALDKLLDDARTTLDRNKRADLYKQAQKILFDDQPFAVFWQAPQVILTRKNIQNYPPTRNGFWGVRDYDRLWKSK